MKRILLKMNMALIFIMILFATISFSSSEYQSELEKLNNALDTELFLITGEENTSVRVRESDINIWQQGEDLTVSKENTVSLPNGKWRYYFKVSNTGTYSIDTLDYGYGNIKQDIQIKYLDKYRGELTEAGYGRDGESEGNFVKNNYVLSSEDIHYIDFDEFYFKNGESTTLNYKYLHSNTSNRGNERVSTVIQENEAEDYEKIISWFIRKMGEGLNWLISKVIGVGKTISLDKLIFDQSTITNLAIFSSDYKYYEGGKNELVGNSLKPLNDIFDLFRRIALLTYMVILVYMGVQILLMTANANRKAKYKELILDWIKGIAILFFFPYVIRYTILLNHAFVTHLYNTIDNKSVIAGAEIDGSSNATLEDVDNVKISDNKNDYMTQMYKTARESERISDAICWLIMYVQIVQFFIVYMKRLITVIFLIAVFPLVTITYAIDKVNDGKAQAFNNWFKEFVLQVFIQSFHAINYVIVMSVVLGDTANWFIKMVGITYVAKGGDILRGLFAQMRGGAGSDGGPLEVAKAYARTKITIDSISSIRKSASRVLGAGSTVGRGINRIHQASDGWLYGSTLKAEKKANEVVRLDRINKNDKENRNSLNNYRNYKSEEMRLKGEIAALSGSSNPDDIEKANRLRKELEDKQKEFVKSIDNLTKLSSEELQSLVESYGFTEHQKMLLQGTLNHAAAIAIVRNHKNERNVDVRTSVDTIFRERKEHSRGRVGTGIEMLDEYIELTKDEKGISNKDLHRISAAHSITIDEAAKSARVPIPEPRNKEARLRYALDVVDNAYKGEYDIDELHRHVAFINSVRGDAACDAIISTREKEIGFRVKDFELNLAVQTINESNKFENVGDASVQAMIDDSIDKVRAAETAHKGKEILEGLNIKIDDLRKGYMPILHEKEDERSKLQRELAKKISPSDLIGRYGEDYDNYLDDRASEVYSESGKLFAKGVGGTLFGAGTGAIKTATGIGASATSLGATYSGGKDGKTVIVNVSNTLKTVDGIGDKLGKVGTYVSDNVIRETSNNKITRKSVNINKKYYKDQAIKQMVDEEMIKKENVRNKLKGRLS